MPWPVVHVSAEVILQDYFIKCLLATAKFASQSILWAKGKNTAKMKTWYRHLANLNKLSLAELPFLASEVSQFMLSPDTLLEKQCHCHMATSRFIPAKTLLVYAEG